MSKSMGNEWNALGSNINNAQDAKEIADAFNHLKPDINEILGQVKKSAMEGYYQCRLMLPEDNTGTRQVRYLRIINYLKDLGFDMIPYGDKYSNDYNYYISWEKGAECHYEKGVGSYWRPKNKNE